MKYLKEYKKYDTYYAMSFDEVEKKFKYFHLTTELLTDDVFTFTPKIPTMPYQDDNGHIIEDNFTPRISLSTSINKCVDALDCGYNLNIYACNSIPNIQELNIDCKLPEYNDKFSLVEWVYTLQEKDYNNVEKHIKANTDLSKTDEELSYIDFLQYIISPTDLPPYLREYFYACVPDAKNTNEVWSLSPLEMVFIGEYDPNGKIFYDIGQDNNIPTIIKKLDN